MKLRYIFTTLLAALTVFTGCEKEISNYLDEIKVSSSYLSFPAAGGQVDVIMTTTDSWAVKDLPDWIAASPESGAAGESTVKFTASAATETREALFSIECAGKVQSIKAIQVTEKVEPKLSTMAEVIEAGSGSFRIKGTITKIANTSYGNWYLSDGTTTANNGLGIYVYGTRNKKGNTYDKNNAAMENLNCPANPDAWEISVGDIITVEGPYSLYNGTTPEMVDVTVIEIERSLISVEDFDFKELPPADTTFNLVVKAKESPLLLSSDAEWLQIVAVNKDGSYQLHADANERTAKRTANVTIKGPTAIKSVEIIQAGVPASGASVSEIIAMADASAVQTLQSTTTVAKTTKGIVVSDGAKAIYVYGDKVADVKVGDNVQINATKTTYNGVPELTDITAVFVDSQGNEVKHPDAKDITAEAGTYAASEAEYVKISGTLSINKDKGYYNLALDDFADGTKMGSIVYPVAELNANSFDGKKITVTGYFNGISGKGVYINVIATKIAEYVDNPKGTVTNPYSPSDVIAILSSGNAIEGNVYIKGIVSQTTNYNFGPSYNNASFWISDDGTYYNDLTKDFEAYSIYWLGGSIEAPTPAADIKGNFAIGDEVVLYGAVTAFTKDGKTTYETASKKAKIYSINKAVTDANGLGNKDYPFNTAGAFTYIDVTQEEIAAAKAEGLSGDALPKVKDVYVKGKVSKVEYSFEKNAGSEKNDGMATFWTSDDGTFANDKTKDFEAYGVYYLGGRKWVKGQDTDVAVGDEVILFGQLTKYTSSSGSTTYETSSKKAYVYSHNGKTE